MTVNQAHTHVESAIHALSRLAITWRALGLEKDAARAEQAIDTLITELNWLRTEIGLKPMRRVD